MRDLTQGHEAACIFRFAVPMLLGNVFQQLYNMIDSFVVGQFVGKQALAAVGQAFPVMFVSVSLIMGITLAGNILIAQFYGARETGKMQAIVDTTLWITKYVAIAMTVLGLALAPAILALMQTPDDVMPSAILFLRIIFVGSFASFGYNAVSAILRGFGDSKTPLYALIASTLVNIALDFLFVLVFRWGVAGTAVATVIAQAVSLVWVLVALKSRHPDLRVSVFFPRRDLPVAKKIFAVGLPSGMQQALVGAGLMTVTGVVNGFGTNPAAAFSAAGKLDSFAVMPALNIGLAISTFTGQNLGAGRKDRVRRGLFWGSVMALAISFSVTAAMYLWGREFMLLFSSDSEVIRIGVEYLRIVSLGYAFQTLMFCFSGVIRGAGATMFTMFMTLSAMWIVRIPCALVLSRFRGTAGIWWAIVIGFAVGMSGTVLYYYFGNWDRGVVSADSVSDQLSG